jgi:hypothetical protein
MRFICKCLAFAIVLLPIMSVYGHFLESALMADSAVSDNVLKEFNPMWDEKEQQFRLSCLGMQGMCRECYCFMNGLSVSKLQRLMTRWRKTKARSVSRKHGSGLRRSMATIDLECWFRELIECMGEPAPDSSGLIYLPPGTKADYWKQYQDDRIDQPKVKRSTFFAVWAQKFPKLKVHLSTD